MATSHGAAFLYGLLPHAKVRTIFESAGVERTYSDDYSTAALTRRHSFSAAISRAPEHEWLYTELWAIFVAFNQAFKLDIQQIDEPLQVIRYPIGGQIDWHVDGQEAHSSKVRKLSLSIQLSDGHDYVGGDIEFAAQPRDPFARMIGSAVCFPSYCPHRITPVAQGQRFSLVAFAVGPAFR